MRLLLDTNALIWTLTQTRRLGPTALEAIGDPENDVYVSVVGVWEIEIKRAKGRLPIPDTVGEALSAQAFRLLPVTLPHVLAVESLPRRHRDPFDRMLVAQARLENLTLVTGDRRMRDYPIAVLPAS